MNIWLVMFVSGLITYGIRLSFILLWGQIKFPTIIERSLQYVPPAVLSALIVPELLFNDSQLDVAIDNSRLIAGILAVLVAWKTKSVLLTIITGMAGIIFLEWIL